MYEYLVMQGFTAAQAELLINSMTDAEKELFQTRMGLGAEYALAKQINELIDKNANKDALDPDKLLKLEGYPIPEPLPPVPGHVPPDKLGPNDTGGDQIPKPSEPLPGYQPLDPEQLGPNHTGGDQLVDKDWRDNILTSQQSSEAGKGTNSAQGLVGKDFENYLNQTLGGKGSFTYKGREFDGTYGPNNSIWYEAKSGRYWQDHAQAGSKGFEKFKSDVGSQASIAKQNGASFEVHSNTPIPQHVKDWLTSKNIPFKEY